MMSWEPRRPPEERACASGGISSSALYRLTADLVTRYHGAGGRLVDVGCGKGQAWAFVSSKFDEYIGLDLVSYPQFPAEGRFLKADLDEQALPLPNEFGHVVISLGVIEYLENPWRFSRELARVTKTGGLVVLGTTNQLSLLSKMTLLLRNRFNAFQRRQPGAPITALVEGDLIEMARSAGLSEVDALYTDDGRIPFTGRRWPEALGFRGRAFSEAVVTFGVKRAGVA